MSILTDEERRKAIKLAKKCKKITEKKKRECKNCVHWKNPPLLLRWFLPSKCGVTDTTKRANNTCEMFLDENV